jgi:hypothetical protein
MKPHRSPLMGLAVLVFIWTVTFPRPEQVVLLANLALVALALALVVTRRRPYLEGGSVLLALFILPGIGLALRVSAYVQLFSRFKMLAFALAASALLALLIALADKAQRTLPRLIAMLILHAPLAYAGALYTNCTLDAAAPQIFHTTVRRKYRSSSAYHLHTLTLGPWGPRVTDDTDLVSADVYYSVHQGQPATVKLYPGRLGVSWFSIEPP